MPPGSPIPPPPGGALLGRSRPIRSHLRRPRRVPVILIVAVILGLGAIGAGLRFVPGSPFAAKGGGTAADEAPIPFHSAPVTAQSLHTSGFFSWALLDRRSGAIEGPDNVGVTSTTARMVSAWLAADYLNQIESTGTAADRRPAGRHHRDDPEQ